MLTNEIHKNTKYFIYLIFVSVILRLFFWYLIPESRFASDEEGYFSTGIFLYQNGRFNWIDINKYYSIN